MKITDKIKMVTMAVAAVATLGAAVMVGPNASADTNGNATTTASTGDANFPGATGQYLSDANSATGGQTTDLMSTLNTVLNVVLGLIGFVAVVFIIFGGFQYITSSGDAAKVTKAKNTILYGVVGLVVVLLAFAIVNFVLGNVKGS